MRTAQHQANRRYARPYKKEVCAPHDCPHRKLARGKYKGQYADEVDNSYQQWLKSIRYPERMFEREGSDEAGAYADEVCNTNYYGHNNF